VQFGECRLKIVPLIGLIAVLVYFSASPAGVDAQFQRQAAADTPPVRGVPVQKLIKTLKTTGSPSDFSWSQDGTFIAMADTINTRITIFDSRTYNPLHVLIKKVLSYPALVFLPDNKTLATSGFSLEQSGHPSISLSLIDVASGSVSRNIDGPFESGLNLARMLAISQSSPYAATVTQKDQTGVYLNLYRTDDWSLIKSIPLHDFIASLAFNPVDGHLAVLTYGRKLQIWEPAQQKMARELEAFRGSASGEIAFSIDGFRLACAHSLALDSPSSVPGSPPGIDLWDARDWHPIVQHSNTANAEEQRARSISFSADGRYLASLNYDGKVRLWDANSVALIGLIQEHETGGVMVRFSPSAPDLAITRNWKVDIIRLGPTE